MTTRSNRRRHSRRGGPDSAHMRLRAQLFQMILEIARRDNLSDWALAHIVNTSRTRASTLLHGHIARFNSETLVDILARLGVSVEITVTRTQPYARWHLPNPRPGWKPNPFCVRG